MQLYVVKLGQLHFQLRHAFSFLRKQLQFLFSYLNEKL